MYARLATAAATKFALPAPASIKLPVICKLAFCVVGTPAILTTGINVVGAMLLPMFGKLVILIAVFDVAMFYPYAATALMTAKLNTGCSVVVPLVSANVISKLPVFTLLIQDSYLSVPAF